VTQTLDTLVIGFDRALKTLTGGVRAARESPAEPLVDLELDEAERRHAAGLMRVNHTGEICAQALYEGQALVARQTLARQTLLDAAAEERDHLGWCRERLTQLQSQPSVLDPLFYSASFVVGIATGLAGDKVSLGFVEATEDQVVEHLDRHMDSLPNGDLKSRAIVAQMREDESRHGEAALARGGLPFPAPVKQCMTLVSKLMTATSYRL